MDDNRALAESIAEILRQRGETVAVAESSAGGLISAALLSVAGASAYFRGGAVAYTTDAKTQLAGVTADELAVIRAATPEHALILAQAARRRLGVTWGIGETGAAGPTGNRYGDPAGHTCIAVAGPVQRSGRVLTGEADRWTNMVAFTSAALRLFREVLTANH